MKTPRFLSVLVLSALALVSIPSCVSESGSSAGNDAPKRLQMCDLLSDHAVLQRSASTHVWGKATPYAKVKVRIGEDGWFAKSATAETTAAEDGTWLASVDVSKLGDGPYTMTVTGGGETLTRYDILIGEVFLASGQSNMEKPLGPRTNQHPIPDYMEIAKASALQPNAVRMATIKEKQVPSPSDTFVGQWELPGETTTPKYSAVAYFAAEQLHKELGVPIGIIHSSLGGSKVQVWTSREALVAGGEDPNETFRGKTSTYLYNGMVYPLRNASFRSVLWFQGEQNMDDAEKYDKLYALMTSSWRKLFQRDDLKFYFVTLNGYKPPDPDPNAVAVQPRIRASQQRTELADPLSHMAVGADTGEALDVHARDKRPIGERLAKLVLKYDFGRDIVADSPIFKSASRNGAEVTVTFDRVGSGLVAHPVKIEYVTQGRRANEKYTRCSPDSQLEDFALRDADGNWHWADDAHIVGKDSVVVSCKAVSNPTAIRYAYRGFPMGNLYNEEGFPAAQFDVELK